MKKEIYVEQLIGHVGEEITDMYLLKRIGKRIRLDGRNEYIEMTLLDKTGEVTGYIFDDYMKPEYYTFKKKVVYLTGQVLLRQDKQPRLFILSMAEASEYSDSDYYNGLQPDEEKLYLEIIRQYTEKISHLGFKELVKAAYEDYRERIAQCPANLSGYSSYNGGILAHTVTVTGIVVYSAKILTKYCRGQINIDFDLLVAASLLHEIGKIDQYTTYPLAQRISEGILVPTAAQTTKIICDVIHRHDLSLTKEEENLLYHVIYACTEDGIIKQMCIEAIIMRQAYLMQTQVEAMGLYLEENRGKSGYLYDRRFNVYVRKKEDTTDEK